MQLLNGGCVSFWKETFHFLSLWSHGDCSYRRGRFLTEVGKCDCGCACKCERECVIRDRKKSVYRLSECIKILKAKKMEEKNYSLQAFSSALRNSGT